MRILSPARILNLWATERELAKEISLAFRWESLDELERRLPAGIILTAFSTWVRISGSRPAEYSSLYLYLPSKSMERWNVWFKFVEKKIRKTNPNVFVLYTDDLHLLRVSKDDIAPIPQIYVDIYSIGGPEAPPYLKDIIEKHPELSIW